MILAAPEIGWPRCIEAFGERKRQFGQRMLGIVDIGVGKGCVCRRHDTHILAFGYGGVAEVIHRNRIFIGVDDPHTGKEESFAFRQEKVHLISRRPVAAEFIQTQNRGAVREGKLCRKKRA